MDKSNNSDTPRSEDGHLKRMKTANKSSTPDSIQRTVSANSNSSKGTPGSSTRSTATTPGSSDAASIIKFTTTVTTPTYSASQTLIEASISSARTLISDIRPIDANDVERIKTLEIAIQQLKEMFTQLSKHLTTTRAELEAVKEQHEQRMKQFGLQRQEHQQAMIQYEEERDTYKHELLQAKEDLELLDHIWMSHEQEIQKRENERVELEAKKSIFDQEALERRAKIDEALDKAANSIFAKDNSSSSSSGNDGEQSPHTPPPRHPSPVREHHANGTTGSNPSPSAFTTTEPQELQSNDGGDKATATTVTDTFDSASVAKLQGLEAKRTALLTEYAENLELLKGCRELINDLQSNLGPEAVASLRDKIQERDCKIAELEQQLQLYQASEMVEEKTADALLSKMEQIFERRLAHADEEFSVVLEAAAAKDKALEQKVDDAMKRYVERHQESITAEERGSQVEFELMHQRNRVRELELQLQQLQGLSGLA